MERTSFGASSSLFSKHSRIACNNNKEGPCNISLISSESISLLCLARSYGYIS